MSFLFDPVDRRPRVRAYTRASLGALAMIAACDIPSIPDAPPALDVRWVVPAPTTRIAVASLLPSGVSIVLPDSSGFTVSIPTVSVVRTLGQDCAACVAVNTQTVPKPAFTGGASVSSALPGDISSAVLTGGTLTVTVTNGYTFDPIRPNGAAAPYGYAVITVTNNGVVLAKDSTDGSTTALPANGGTLTRAIALSGTITGSAPVIVSLSLNSPAGSSVLIDASRTLKVDASASNLKVASANVTVSNKTISPSTSSMDLSGIDSTITNHVESGSLLLTVSNPFTVAGTLTVKLTPDNGAPITKTISLVAGSSTPSIAFNQTELKSLLNHNITIVYSGTVNASGSGTINVSPKQTVVITSKLDVFLEVGG